MITVTDAVNQILSKDGFIIEALQRDLLNISAYAKVIAPEVENIAKKPVKHATIVVTLSRLAQKVTSQSSITPHIVIDSYSVTSSLYELTYAKTDAVVADIKTINHSFIDNLNAFYTMTLGVNEVTIICSKEIKDRVSMAISQQPKVEIGKLVAISVRFSADYMSVPNTIYSLVGIFAGRQINIIEVVSTYTEVIFIIQADEMEQAIQALQRYQMRTS